MSYRELPQRVAKLEKEIDTIKERLYILSGRLPTPGAAVVTDEDIKRDYLEKKARAETTIKYVTVPAIPSNSLETFFTIVFGLIMVAGIWSLVITGMRYIKNLF
jgi:cell division protein FtsB